MRLRLLILVTFLIFSSAAAFATRNDSSVLPGQGGDTAALYKSRCTRCHGIDGKPKRDGLPDFTDAKWQASRKDEDLTQSITDGKGEMPAYGQILDADQIPGLVKLIRGLAKSGN